MSGIWMLRLPSVVAKFYIVANIGSGSIDATGGTAAGAPFLMLGGIGLEVFAFVMTNPGCPADPLALAPALLGVGFTLLGGGVLNLPLMKLLGRPSLPPPLDR
jgi:hypothetical protein